MLTARHASMLRRGDCIWSSTVVEDANIRFLLSEPIGRGQHGHVFKARVTDEFHVERIVAIKQRPKECDSRDFAEALVHEKIHHPNIVDLYHAFSDDQHHYMAMEYCENGSLADVIRDGPLELFELRSIGIQLFGGIKYIHSQGFRHRDMKAENVLVDSRWNVKIADLGLATLIFPGSSGGCGTFAYAAPEVIAGDDSRCDGSEDIWSIGVLL
jgi:serine/threonine protein kinase